MPHVTFWLGFLHVSTCEQTTEEPQNQQPATTHPGTGDKETLNMNVVGKNRTAGDV